MNIAPLTPDLIPQAAELWHEGWHTAHAPIVPQSLTDLRTMDSFTDRLKDARDTTWAAVQDDTLLGFYMLQGAELYQFYVAAAARGTGTAQTLMAHAEDTQAALGYSQIWLDCTVGNARAARFYEKCGWRNSGTHTAQLVTSTGPYPLTCWKYEKSLAQG